MGAIKCLECNTVLESKYRHDFKMCECENSAFVDGGTEYLRVGAKDLDKVKVLRSCELCGCRLDNKEDVMWSHDHKIWELCVPCYKEQKEKV